MGVTVKAVLLMGTGRDWKRAETTPAVPARTRMGVMNRIIAVERFTRTLLLPLRLRLFPRRGWLGFVSNSLQERG